MNEGREVVAIDLGIGGVEFLNLLEFSKILWRAWKGRLKRFFVNTKAEELAKNKNKQYLLNAQGRGSRIDPATPL